MAIDTQDKRNSIINFPLGMGLPLADTEFDELDRLHILELPALWELVTVFLSSQSAQDTAQGAFSQSAADTAGGSTSMTAVNTKQGVNDDALSIDYEVS